MAQAGRLGTGDWRLLAGFVVSLMTAPVGLARADGPATDSCGALNAAAARPDRAEFDRLKLVMLDAYGREEAVHLHAGGEPLLQRLPKAELEASFQAVGRRCAASPAGTITAAATAEFAVLWKGANP